MARKPSAASTRSKQHQVIRYTYSTSPKQAAKDYNVSTAKLRQFILGNPRRLKSRVQKDPAIRHLYETDPRILAKQKKVKLVPRLSNKRYKELRYADDISDIQTRALEYRTATRVRGYKETKSRRTYPELGPRRIQARQLRRDLLVRGYAQYSTRDSLRAGLENKELTIQDVRSIVGLWQEEYDDLTETRADELIDDIVESSGVEELE